MRYNSNTHLFKIFIPSGVIAMQVGINQKTNIIRAQCFDSSINFVG